MNNVLYESVVKDLDSALYKIALNRRIINDDMCNYYERYDGCDDEEISNVYSKELKELDKVSKLFNDIKLFIERR